MKSGQETDPWGESEIALVEQLRKQGMTREKIAQEIGRSKKALDEKLARMSRDQRDPKPVGRPTTWSKEELKLALTMRSVEKKKWVDIARALGRSVGAVYCKIDREIHGRKIRSHQASALNMVPAAVEQERRHRLTLSPLTLTAALCGDPLPGRSALEQRA